MPTEQNGFWDESGSGIEWSTPPSIVLPLSDAIGGFDIDIASGAEDIPYAENQFTKEDNGLKQEWEGRIFGNPPYGRTENKEWAKKWRSEVFKGRVTSATFLIPANTGTQWFQRNYAKADAFTFIHKRVSFGESNKDATFASVIVSVGDFPTEYWDALDRIPYPTTTMVEK